MGIGALRRHHEDSRRVGETPRPAEADGQDANTEHEELTLEAQREAAEAAGTVREFEAKLELNERNRELDAAAAALHGPAGELSVAELGLAVAEAAQAVTEAQEAVQAAIAEDDAEREAKANDEGKTPEGEDTKHGDLERPTAQGSTAAWIAYAKADPNGSPVADLTERKGLRDEIAQAYLGK